MAKYKRSASRGGFSPVQVSRADVQQILNRGNRAAQLLKEQQDSDLEERERQNQAANNAFDFERRQEERNYDIEIGNIDSSLRASQIRQRDADREFQQTINRLNQESQQQERVFSSIAKLSSTAAKMVTDYQEKQDKITKQNDIAKYFSDPEYKARVDAAATRYGCSRSSSVCRDSYRA